MSSFEKCLFISFAHFLMGLFFSCKFKFLIEKEDMWPTNMKNSSSSLIVREMQIKTTMRNHSHPLKWLKFKTETITIVGEEVNKLELLHTAGGRAIVQLFGKQFDYS